MLHEGAERGRPLSSATPADEVDDAQALREGNRERSIAVLSREEGLSAGLVSHVIPLLAGPLSDYAVFALRKVAEERVGQLTDALLDPERRLQDPAPGRQSPFRGRLTARGRCAHPGTGRRAVRRAVPERAIGRRHSREESPNPHRSGADSGCRPCAKRQWGGRCGRAVACSTMAGTANRRSTSSSAIGQGRASAMSLRCCLLFSRVSRLRSPSAASTVENSRLRGTALEYLEGVLPAKVRDRLWPFLVEGRTTAPSQTRDEVMSNLLRSSSSVTLHGVALL